MFGAVAIAGAISGFTGAKGKIKMPLYSIFFLLFIYYVGVLETVPERAILKGPEFSALWYALFTVVAGLLGWVSSGLVLETFFKLFNKFVKWYRKTLPE